MTAAKKAEIVPLKDLEGGTQMLKRLVDQAVYNLNSMYAVGSVQTYLAMGRYVLKTFFEGDPRIFRSHGRKSVSFRALAEREDLKFGRNHLWACTALVEQFEEMSRSLAESLNFSEHKLLLSVEDRAEKNALAKRAVDELMTVEELRLEVAKALGRRTGPSGRRKGKFAFLKGLGQISKAAELLEDEPLLLTKEDMSPAELKRLLRKLDGDLKILSTFRDELAAVAAA